MKEQAHSYAVIDEHTRTQKTKCTHLGLAEQLGRVVRVAGRDGEVEKERPAPTRGHGRGHGREHGHEHGHIIVVGMVLVMNMVMNMVTNMVMNMVTSWPWSSS